MVLRALQLYCEGCRLDETAYILEKKYGVARSRSCLSKWLKDFNPPYRQIRRLNNGHHPVARNHLFTRRGLNYEYQLHLPKLRFAKHFAGVRAFLEFLPRGIPEAVFEDGVRCSTAVRECAPPLAVASDCPAFTVQAPNPIFHAKHNWLNAMCLQALRLARHNRERHPVVEGYFPSCDRNTIATEVSLWFYDKAQSQTFAGHIDIVQVNFGKLWVLDFKPNAAKERVEKVTCQLSPYAQGLAYRTGVKLSEIRCAWFDETDFFGFDPQWRVA